MFYAKCETDTQTVNFCFPFLPKALGENNSPPNGFCTNYVDPNAIIEPPPPPDIPLFTDTSEEQ